MGTKLTTELVEQASKQVGISEELRRELVAMIADMIAEENDGEEKVHAVKKQWVFIISDPNGRITGIDESTRKSLEEIWGALTGWVVQIPESESPHTAPDRIKEAAHHFNTTKKGRLLPVQTIGEACENIPARIFKEQSVWVKTKCAIYAIPAANELPDTPSVLGEDRGSAKAAGLRIDGDGIHSI